MGARETGVGFLVSVAIHAAAVLVAVLLGFLPIGGCRTRQADIEIPIGFLVEEAGEPTPEVAPPEPEPPEQQPPEPEPPAPEPEPVPEPPAPEPEPTPAPVPQKPRHVVEVSKVKVRRDKPEVSKRPKTPSKQELDKIIRDKMGPVRGPIGDPRGTTASPSADGTAMARIKSTLYGAWYRPAYEDRGSNTVVLRLTFRADGSFTSVIETSSGSPAFDNSVLNAAKGVGRFTFLPDGFVRRHPSLTIDFCLDAPL